MLSHESLLVHLGSFRAYRIFRSCLKPVEVVAGCKFRVATGGLAVRRSHTNVAACILWFKMEVLFKPFTFGVGDHNSLPRCLLAIEAQVYCRRDDGKAG